MRTELVNADRRIEALITTDALTGLSNRRHLGDALELALARARRDGAGFALLVLDVDRFRRNDDSLGSAIGDPCWWKWANASRPACGRVTCWRVWAAINSRCSCMALTSAAPRRRPHACSTSPAAAIAWMAASSP